MRSGAAPPLRAADDMNLYTLILALFLFSGVSGLIYEVVWSRMFAVLLGTSVYAVATVLGVFMGGMALGSWFFGRLADRKGANGLRIYAFLELGIAAFALALPALIHLSNWIYRLLWPAVSESSVALLALRVLLAVLVLIIPSALMGGTLPVLSRHLLRGLGSSGREIGLLYGINTIGAVLGVLLAGFYLLENFGLRKSLWAAGGLSAVIGLLALLASARVPEDKANRDENAEGSTQYSRSQVRLVLLLYGLSGFLALALEVLWTRSLMYWVSVDAWAFTSMLAAFLCGLGLGSVIFAPFVPRLARPVLVFGVLQVLIGLATAASVPLFAELPEVWESTYADWEANDPLLRKMALKLSSSFFIMLLPTLLMGMSFPVVCRIYVHRPKSVGSNLGDLYALNTGAAIFGSIAAGFWLIPWLGVQKSILLLAGAYMLSGVVACQVEFVRGIGRQLPGLTAGFAMAAAMYFSIETGPAVLQGKEFRGQPGRYKLLYVNEGAAGSLAVIENEIGTRILNVNGIITAINNFRDMQVHRMLSHLPLLIHPDPKEVLVVGFGMGSTVWGCCQHEVDQVDVVELMQAEQETARYFADINHGVIEHDKLEFIEGDGRNYLLASPKEYDVISFNAIHPRFSANLYTRDFYELCFERMSDDGVLCAWLTQNSMLDAEWRSLCASLVSVFPHSSIWFSNPEHFCLIASKKELAVDLEDWKSRMARVGTYDDLRESNLEDPMVLLGRFMVGTKGLQDYVQGVAVNTDDLPLIEFARESKRDEKSIAEELVRMRESVLPYVQSSSLSDRERLLAYEESSIWMMRGQVVEWYDRASLAARCSYLRGLLQTPDNQDLRHYLDFSWLVHRKVSRLIATNPEDPAPLAFRGKMLVLEGDLAGAESAFKAALSLSPGFPPAHVELGILHALADQTEACVEVLASIVDRVNDPRTWFVYAESLRRLGRAEESALYLERAKAVEPAVAEWFQLRRELLQVMLKQR